MIPRLHRQISSRAQSRHVLSCERTISASAASLHPRHIAPSSYGRHDVDLGDDEPVSGFPPRIKSFFNPGRAAAAAAARKQAIPKTSKSGGGGSSPSKPDDGGGDDGSSNEQPPLPSNFAATYLKSPSSSGRKPLAQPYFINALKNQLAISFLPYNQLEKASDPTIAVVSPIEGTEHLIRDTVEQAARSLGAEVVRIDTIECLGMRGDGPLGAAGECLKIKDNPLLQVKAAAERKSPAAAAAEEEEAAEEEDEEGEMEEHVIHVGQPIEIQLPFGGIGGGGRGGGSRIPAFGGGAGPIRTPAERTKIDKLFKDLVNLQPASGSSKVVRSRIIYVKDATAMSSTFSQWYPSLLAAVRERRKSGNASGLMPTTIVLGCNPSLLHEVLPSRQDAEDADEAPENVPGIPPALARLLAGARANTMANASGGVNELWHSSKEADESSRRRRLKERLSRFKSNDEAAMRGLVPSFGESESHTASGPPTPPGIIDIGSMIERMRNASAQRGQDGKDQNVVKIWKYLGVLPIERDVTAEIRERQMTRIRINTLLLKRAIASQGGRLTSDSVADELNKNDESGTDPVLRELEDLRAGFSDTIWQWSTLQHLASMSIGHRLSESRGETVPVVSWKTIALANLEEEQGEHRSELWKTKELDPAEAADIQPKSRKVESSSGESEDVPEKDPVVEAIKNDKKLPAHEKRLLGCIVDSNRLLATSFKDVHLPEKTIDGIRSMVTLPLLYPQMFKRGILAQHTTTGALLFGPPGTGKSHLIRALARESGARMLAIQPSDVNDMYVGEGEKMVKAVFSLARKLAPCIVFVDEVDSLFGARSGSGAGGAQAHRQVLTEFMQEMDGLTSASANKNQVIVIGATNRPYDLDEAVLRRLPRRMLVDLPGKKDREAILRILLRDEELGDDVDLAKIAERTDTYSGSDLKHLCVQAALASIKDSVTLPWQTKLADGHQPALQAAARRPGPSTSELVQEEEEGGEEQDANAEKHKHIQHMLYKPSVGAPLYGGTKIRGVHRAVPQATPGAASRHPMFLEYERELSAFREADIRRLDGGLREKPMFDPKRYIDIIALTQARTEVDKRELREMQEAEEQEREREQDEDEEQEEEEEEEEAVEDASPSESSGNTRTDVDPSRVLHMRHFETAMKEITPSSSESGNLPELRKWNAQYGEGGTERGKKSGYGGRFGFGDEQATNDLDPAYGRVTPEST